MKLKTTNIKGKEYVEVPERVRAFRSLESFIGYTMESEFVSLTEKECIIKTIVKNKDGNIVSTGFAHEVKGSGPVNKTSHVENCETSSVGRALGFLGIGIDTSIASAEEVANAIKKQNELAQKKNEMSGQDYLLELINQSGTEPTEKTCEWVDGLTEDQLKTHIKAYEKKLK